MKAVAGHSRSPLQTLDLMGRNGNKGRRDGDHDDRIRRIEQLSAELARAVENTRVLRTKAVRLSAERKRLLTAKRKPRERRYLMTPRLTA